MLSYSQIRHRPRVRLFFACLLSVWLITTSVAFAANQQQATQAQLATLKKSLQQAHVRLSKDQAALTQEEAALENLDKQIGDTGKAIYQLNQKLHRLKDNLTGYEAQKSELEAQILDAQAALMDAVRKQYQHGRQPRLLMLLNQRNPETLSRMMKYYDYFNQGQQKQLFAYRDMLQTLSQTNTNIDITKDAIVAERDQLQAKQAQQALQREQHQHVLTALRQDVGRSKQQITRLKKNQTRLKTLLSEIEKSVSLAHLSINNKAFKSLRGKLKWPVVGQVRRRFGSLNQGIRYDGLMMSAALGAPVFSVHHGRVVFSDALRGYGLVTIIDHGDGYHTLYGHNDSLLKAQGDWVEQGETIATVGFSGGNSEPGLYFAIRYKGKATNPQRWLARK